MIQVPEDLKGLYLEATLTGSRVICDPPVLDTDLDVVLLVRSEAPRFADAVQEALEAAGYSRTAGDYEDSSELGIGFSTFRKGDVNLIVTASPELYRRWCVATSCAIALNLRSKPQRIALFQVCLYGPDVADPVFELPTGVQPWAAT